MAHAADPTSVDHQTLSRLIPVNSLSTENLSDLARKTAVLSVTAGQTLFRQGDRDNQLVYLLDGEVELREASGPTQVVSGGSAEANHALVPQQPRKHTALARTDCRVIRIDNDLLDILLTWDQSAGYVVTELEDGGESVDDTDWMTAMLQSRIFYQVPPANIQEIFKRMESMPVQAGEVIIRQGDAGDYYYIIRQGEAGVSRRAPNGADIPLATLRRGEGFGEEALITETERNATITMKTDGTLMRLSKTDFNDLLKAPILEEVTLEQGRKLVSEGAVWLDVRLESEHAKGAIEASLNIPLYLLRLRMRELDRDTPYIIYCDTGRRSAAAAYLLSESGFEVRILQDGFNAEAEAA